MFAMEREYRLLIDVGKFAMYQTDGFLFFFCIPHPSDVVRKGGGGSCLEPPGPPRQDSCGASRQGLGQVHLQGPGSELLLQFSEIPGKRVNGGGTLAESLPIEFGRMVALISLVLFALIFHPGLHWTESGVEGEIAQGQYLDELLVSQVALYKLATAL